MNPGWGRNFRGRNRNRCHHRSARRRLGLEPLEPRQLLSAGPIDSPETAAAAITGAQVLGAIDFLELADLHPSAGDQWFQLDTVRRGLLSAETIAADPSGEADIALYDQDGQELATSSSPGEKQRLDWQTAAGATYFLQLSGTAAAVDLRLANLVEYAPGASEVIIHGTDGDDVLEIHAGPSLVASINGVRYQWEEMASLWAYGGAGSADLLILHDSPGRDLLATAASYAALFGDGFEYQARGFERTCAYADDGGMDTAKLFDSRGDDLFEASPETATLEGGGYFAQADHFEQVHAYATAGGDDSARLAGSQRDDTFSGNWYQGALYGQTYYNRAKHFEQVEADAGPEGYDTAQLFDSDGDDQFLATPDYASMSGAGFAHGLTSFDAVTADARAGGFDVAELFDSEGKDLFAATPTLGWLSGDGFDNRAVLFDQVHAYATAGGRDTAKLFDSSGDDFFQADPVQGALYGAGYYNRAKQFEAVHAYATAGGYDAATLLDSPGDDLFTLTDVFGALYGEGFYNRAKTFESILAVTSAGGDDMAQLTESALDRLTLDGQWGTVSIPPDEPEPPKDDPPTRLTLSFQQGVGNYAGMIDTKLKGLDPDAAFGSKRSIEADGEDHGTQVQALLRLDDLFGESAAQIHGDDEILSAMLVLNVANQGDAVTLHRMLVDWNEADTWNTFGGDGIAADQVEAVATPDAATEALPPGTVSIDVTSSVRAWQADPVSNHGWVLFSTGSNLVGFDSREALVVANRPRLVVEVEGSARSVPNEAPVLAPIGEKGVALGSTLSLKVSASDADTPPENLTFGLAQGAPAGAAIDPTTGVFSWAPTPEQGTGQYQVTFTVTDGAGMDTETIRITVVDPAWLATLVFQEDVGGYFGTFDTKLKGLDPDIAYGSKRTFEADGEDHGAQVQGLLRFENLFGNHTGKIRPQDHVTSATLVLNVANEGDAVTLHRMIADWSEEDTWNTFGGDGIAADDVEAAAAPDAATISILPGPLMIDVTASVRAWQADPSSNRGWAILSSGTNLVGFDSREASTVENRPQLVVHLNDPGRVLPQYVVRHPPRLQLGDAPLAGFAGSETDQIEILWQTVRAHSGTQDGFLVEYRRVGDATWSEAGPIATIDTGVETRIIHSVEIDGLSYDTDYEYRVTHLRADEIVETYQETFHTRLPAGDDAPFTFAAYGDSLTRSASDFRVVQDRINRLDPAFALLLGDNTYDDGAHREFDARFAAQLNPEAADWVAGHVDYLGFGNHDVTAEDGRASEEDFSVPVPVEGVTAPAALPADERPEHNYSFDYGNVHFLTFDSNSIADPVRLAGLLDWVEADLAACDARWKMVFAHHPVAPVPDKEIDPDSDAYRQVLATLTRAGIDLYLVGHSHTFQWTYPLQMGDDGRIDFVLDTDKDYAAGAGSVQVVAGVGGNFLRSGSFSGYPMIASAYSATTNPPSEHGFAQIDVTPTQLTVSYIAADDGSVIDRFTVSAN